MNRDNKPVLGYQSLILPADLNNNGTLFGGAALSYLDMAGAVVAADFARQPILLAAVKEASFLKPCYAGDMVEIWCTIKKVGTTSITIAMEMIRKRVKDGELIEELTTTADYVYVAVDADKKPTRIKADKA